MSVTDTTDGLWEPYILKVDGKPFSCDCGCRILSRKAGTNLYRCNACGKNYEGDPPAKQTPTDLERAKALLRPLYRAINQSRTELRQIVEQNQNPYSGGDRKMTVKEWEILAACSHLLERFVFEAANLAHPKLLPGPDALLSETGDLLDPPQTFNFKRPALTCNVCGGPEHGLPGEKCDRWTADRFPALPTLCSVCGKRQYNTPSGACCINRHVGAKGVADDKETK